MTTRRVSPGGVWITALPSGQCAAVWATEAAARKEAALSVSSIVACPAIVACFVPYGTGLATALAGLEDAK